MMVNSSSLFISQQGMHDDVENEAICFLRAVLKKNIINHV